MSKADEVLDVLRTAERPMAASEIAPLCASLRDSLDACWVLQRLEQKNLIARSGTRRVGRGVPRVCYVITEAGRNRPPDGTPPTVWVETPPPPAAPVDHRKRKAWGLDPIRPRVFCASLADVFDNEVPTEWRQDLFELIGETPNIDWLLLTKRIGNVPKMLEQPGMPKDGLPPNVWLGITVVNQAEADRDIPKLLAVSAAKRFLSMEPLLGPVDVSPFLWGKHETVDDVCQNCPRDADCECGYHTRTALKLPALHWVIVGGESGPRARPMHIGWAKDIVRQCKAAAVPVFVKQLGAQPRGWCVGALHADDRTDLADDYCDAHEAHEGAACERCVLLADRKGGDMAEWGTMEKRRR